MSGKTTAKLLAFAAGANPDLRASWSWSPVSPARKYKTLGCAALFGKKIEKVICDWVASLKCLTTEREPPRSF